MTELKLGFPIRIGILGGGQLARMLALACHTLGVVPHIYAAQSTDCATQVVANVIFSDGSDERLRKFIRGVEVLVIENEFIDLDQLERCLGVTPLVPSLATLRTVQSKLDQKRALRLHKIQSLPFVEVGGESAGGGKFKPSRSLGDEVAFNGGVVLKTARFGYDGKGTFIFPKGVKAQDFFKAHPDFHGYAEPLVKFKKELAVIVARSSNGTTSTFPVVESNQVGGVCHWVVAPAPITLAAAKRATAVATKTITKMGGVGVFGVEMFLLGSGEIVVNEIAPRVHNTGHYTMDAHAVSQFEQHIRCAVGLPLVKPRSLFKGSAMVNILGQSGSGAIAEDARVEAVNVAALKKLLGHESEAFWIHWYGKTGPAAGRKLGHINAGARTIKRALALASKVRNAIKI